MKRTFKHMTEWADWSESSPSHYGQLPCAVILPDGERVEMDEGARFAAEGNLFHAQLRGSKATYAIIHPKVRFRESHWGDDGSRRVGRAGCTLEVLAPKGSRCLFTRRCWCGGEAGEAEEEELDRAGCAPALYHASCEAELDEQERLIEEHRRYVAEQERQADEEWEAEFSEAWEIDL